MSDTGLAAALAAEHAAIFGYGIVGAHLTKAELAAAQQADAAHRSRRDALALRIVAASATPPAAQAAYTLPYPVIDRASALKLATDLEEGASRAWRQSLTVTSGDERKLALDALIDCAVRATHWRQTAGTSPATVTFPGAPS